MYVVLIVNEPMSEETLTINDIIGPFETKEQAFNWIKESQRFNIKYLIVLLKDLMTLLEKV
jgi:hypothetical protein